MTTTSTATKRRREERNPPTGRRRAHRRSLSPSPPLPTIQNSTHRLTKQEALFFCIVMDLFKSYLYYSHLFCSLTEKIESRKAKTNGSAVDDRKKVMQYCNRLLQNNAPLSMPIPWQKKRYIS